MKNGGLFSSSRCSPISPHRHLLILGIDHWPKKRRLIYALPGPVGPMNALHNGPRVPIPVVLRLISNLPLISPPPFPTPKLSFFVLFRSLGSPSPPPYLLPSLSWVSPAAAGDGRGNWRRRVADLALKRVRSATDGSTLFPELMMMAFPLTSPSRSSSSSASSSVHPEAGLYSVSSSSSSSHLDDVLLFPSASHPEAGLYSVSSASSESNPDAMLTSSASHPDTVFIPSASHPDAVLLFPSASSSSASASPLEDPSDWDLASIESSLSPDPDLDQLFCMDLDPLLLAASESVIIRYQFDSDFFPPSSSSSSSLPPEYDGDHCVDQQDDQLRKQRAQACRNAQIALAMSPIRQYQAKLQAAQRRGGHQQQRAKRKFSLKNGATNVAGKTERSSAGATTLLNNSVRRWQKEIGQLGICRNGPKRAQQKKSAKK